MNFSDLLAKYSIPTSYSNFSDLLAKYSIPTSRSLENSNPNRVRHNVYSPEGKEALVLFDKAVGLMKERSSNNPADLLGWNYQAGIHGIWNLNYKNPKDGNGWSREKLANFAAKKDSIQGKMF